MQQFDVLSTGNAGITFGNESTSVEQDELIQEQALVTSQLLPSVKGIMAILDEEIEAISDIRSYIKTLDSHADLTDLTNEYRARELYIGMIERLKSGIANRVGDYEADNG